MTTLIRNATILTSGQEPYVADVFLSGSKISAIGQLERQRAKQVLDASGAFLSPGIIDTESLADLDFSLFDQRKQAEFLLAGVTTLICGQRGYSLISSTVAERDHKFEMARPWRSRGQGGAGWHSFSELARHLKKHPLGVNTATFLGITRDVLGSEFSRPNRSVNHILHNLSLGLKSGAVGISLESQSADPEWVRNFLRALDRNLPGQPIRISMHMSLDTEQIERQLDVLVYGLRHTKASFFLTGATPDLYPHFLEKRISEADTARMRLVIAGDGSRSESLRDFLPVWLSAGERESSDPWFRKRLALATANLAPEKLSVRFAAHNPVLVGRTLAEIASVYEEARGTGEMLIKMLTTTAGRAVLDIRGNEQGGVDLGKDGQELFASLGRPARLSLPASVESLHAVSDLSNRVDSLTRRPAEALGLAGRGRLIPGAIADLVVWTRTEVRHVFVNGVLAVRDSSYQGSSSGCLLPAAFKVESKQYLAK